MTISGIHHVNIGDNTDLVFFWQENDPGNGAQRL